VEIPGQAFPSLVEAFLSEGYRLTLIVDGMTEKKEFSCDNCGATIEVSSPDDIYTILELKPVEDNVERKIKCPKCGSDNVRYWRKPSSRVFVARSG
jgi:DNA-directed RNA polymerase subunit M/transcription elongation factor TFIIS